MIEDTQSKGFAPCKIKAGGGIPLRAVGIVKDRGFEFVRADAQMHVGIGLSIHDIPRLAVGIVEGDVGAADRHFVEAGTQASGSVSAGVGDKQQSQRINPTKL